jgi:Ribosomal RNA adenine dimethylase
MAILYTSLIVILLAIYLVIIFYQLLQFYYLVHPYKVFLVSSQLQKVIPGLNEAINHHTSSVESMNFVELGSGKAGISRYVGKNYKFKEVIGVEGDWLTFQMSRLLNQLDKSRVKVVNEDIFKYQIPANSIIYCYLFPKLLDKLHERGLLKGQLVLSLTFEITDVEPTEIISIDNFQKKLLVYDFREQNK